MNLGGRDTESKYEVIFIFVIIVVNWKNSVCGKYILQGLCDKGVQNFLWLSFPDAIVYNLITPNVYSNLPSNLWYKSHQIRTINCFSTRYAVVSVLYIGAIVKLRAEELTIKFFVMEKFVSVNCCHSGLFIIIRSL